MNKIFGAIFLSLFLMASSSWLAGCGFNVVRPFVRGEPIKYGHAVVIYGVGLETHWNAPRFGVDLVEYSIENQKSTGNCFVFNKTESSIPTSSRVVEYFAFYVPAGYYAYSAFHLVPLRVNGQAYDAAFYAPEGSAVYIGDFVYTKNKVVELRRDPELIDSAIVKWYPELNGQVTLANAVSVQPSRPFLCTP